jgi:hypothetical protein
MEREGEKERDEKKEEKEQQTGSHYEGTRLTTPPSPHDHGASTPQLLLPAYK